MSFFDDRVLLSNDIAFELYNDVKALPIIDYHCHLNDNEIAEGMTFSDIGELWLAGDHYKWRAMRLCGVDEYYITGKASNKEKFFKYAEIMPKLAGNPLYYFSHLELKLVFGICAPLNSSSAENIWNIANEKLKNLDVYKLFELFNVEYVATTDDPLSELKNHGKYGNTTVCPTFRPDKIFEFDEKYYEALSKASSVKIADLESLKAALKNRLDYFVSKGCRIADHGFDFIPERVVSKQEAEEIFKNRQAATDKEKHLFFCHMLEFFAQQYSMRGIVMQLHFGTMRNTNSVALKKIGRDAGFDVFRSYVNTDALAAFLNNLSEQNALPKTILYSNNDIFTPALCAISGSFKNVRVGVAWWMNDTLNGIRRSLTNVSEYAALGTFLGMLTDSRSFLSYARFDFFRRILADFLGGLVEQGEYFIDDARRLMQNICYNNIISFIK